MRAQAETTPEIYGNVDFDSVPERMVLERGQPHELGADQEELRDRLLSDEKLMDLMRAYSFMGDRVADPYAALMPKYGFRGLVDMLTTACDKGIEAVPDAPPELVGFLRAMEATPEWLDMQLVEEGARQERAEMAVLSPISIRAAFIATFMNKYSALPMALTGALSSEGAARRVKETATFFATSVLPGALARYGAGFKAAAMVRLMHSMVRFNAMRKGRWDVSVYGIPIPQVDQMPAGLMGATLVATAAVRAGRKEFSDAERARVELARYRCYLLGLPEALLKATPEEIVTLAVARIAILRPAFDEATCGMLLKATLEAYLPATRSPVARALNRIETGFSKVFFVKQFAGGDYARARSLGVNPTALDRLCFMLAASVSGVRLAAYQLAARLPGLAKLADRRLVSIIRSQLASYGKAHFTTDAASYRPAVPQPGKV